MKSSATWSLLHTTELFSFCTTCILLSMKEQNSSSKSKLNWEQSSSSSSLSPLLSTELVGDTILNWRMGFEDRTGVHGSGQLVLSSLNRADEVSCTGGTVLVSSFLATDSTARVLKASSSSTAVLNFPTLSWCNFFPLVANSAKMIFVSSCDIVMGEDERARHKAQSLHIIRDEHRNWVLKSLHQHQPSFYTSCDLFRWRTFRILSTFDANAFLRRAKDYRSSDPWWYHDVGHLQSWDGGT